MNNIEAVDQVTTAYSKYKNLISIEIKDVTLSLFKEIKKVCKKTKHIEERTEYYDDERDDSFNNWIDIEGEGYGWLWLHKPEFLYHHVIVKSLKRYLEYKEKNLSQNSKCIVAKYDSNIVYHFIEREENMSDQVYTFSNEELHAY